MCHCFDLFKHTPKEASANNPSMIGIDSMEQSLQLHGAAQDEAVLFRRKRTKRKLLALPESRCRCTVTMDAYTGSHHPDRRMLELGHEVRLVPPICVRPFVKRQENDAADAEAICEAAQRPTLRFVAVKTATRQADEGGGRAGESHGAIADDGEEGLPGRRPCVREHREAVGKVRRSDEEQGQTGTRTGSGKPGNRREPWGSGLRFWTRSAYLLAGDGSRGTGRTTGSADHMPETESRTACIKGTCMEDGSLPKNGFLSSSILDWKDFIVGTSEVSVLVSYLTTEGRRRCVFNADRRQRPFQKSCGWRDFAGPNRRIPCPTHLYRKPVWHRGSFDLPKSFAWRESRQAGAVLMLAAWAVSVALSAGCASAQAGQPPQLFDLHHLQTGFAAYQTVLPGSFTAPGRAEIVTIDGSTHEPLDLCIFQVGAESVSPVFAATTNTPAAMVDTVNINGRDFLVLPTHRALVVFDMKSGSERDVLPLPPYLPLRWPKGRVARVDIVRDLNADGRDDLVMPSADGFWIYLQGSDSSFSTARKIGPPEPHRDLVKHGDAGTYGASGLNPENIPWYMGRIHQLDYDRDGLVDLAFWNDDHFHLFRQEAGGTFADHPESFSTGVNFDFDGAYSLAFQFGGKGLASWMLGWGPRLEYTMLHGFRDLNNDEVSDLITVTFAGRRAIGLDGRFNIYFGRPIPSGTAFPSSPNTVANSPGPASGLAWGYATQHYIDIDGDGATDLGLASVKTTLGGMWRALAGKSVTIDVALYRMHDGEFSEAPDVFKRVRTPFSPFSRRGVLFPTVLVGDVNGDGRTDLLTGARWNRLSVFLGTAAPQLLQDDPLHIAVELPSNEFNAMLADLNDDGSEDVIFHYPASDDGNRVTALLSRNDGS